MDGKSSSSFEEVNWSGAPVWATSALPFSNDLLTPNGTSCEEKLKFPCVVLTSNVTGASAAVAVTMTPVSCTGPGGFREGVGRMAVFQLEVPEIESALVNRQ